MSTSDALEPQLDAALPDEQVLGDLSRELASEAGGNGTIVQFSTGDVLIPDHPQIAVVTKAYFKEYLGVGFGSGFRVQVAIGGVQSMEEGIPRAKFCFATLYYSESSAMITLDFHKEWR